ncbi:unnamed protein product, partial [marine sediment metagenome]
AGCSVGCNSCDTDYKLRRRISVHAIADTVDRLMVPGHEMVWITGGEPTDHEIDPLIETLKQRGHVVCVATAGRKPIKHVPWISVSPHDYQTEQLTGAEIKLVPGHNGFDPEKWLSRFSVDGFAHRYIQPMSVDGVETGLEYCFEFLNRYPDFVLSRQDHIHWGKR